MKPATPRGSDEVEPEPTACGEPGCTRRCNAGKPRCFDHLESLPYVRAVEDRKRAMEAEVRRARKGSKVDPRGLLATEVRNAVRFAGDGHTVTHERVFEHACLPRDVFDAVARALEEAGEIKVEVEHVGRGSRIVVNIRWLAERPEEQESWKARKGRSGRTG